MDNGESMQSRAVPASAWLLGAAGLIPFVGLAGVLAHGGILPKGEAAQALLLYGAVILSFMGGVQWGLTMRADAAAPVVGFVASVVPALAGWFAVLLAPPDVAMLVIAATFCALLGYDTLTIGWGWTPRWYAALRFPLTVVAVLSLALGAYLAG